MNKPTNEPGLMWGVLEKSGEHMNVTYDILLSVCLHYSYVPRFHSLIRQKQNEKGKKTKQNWNV